MKLSSGENYQVIIKDVIKKQTHEGEFVYFIDKEIYRM